MKKKDIVILGVLVIVLLVEVAIFAGMDRLVVNPLAYVFGVIAEICLFVAYKENEKEQPQEEQPAAEEAVEETKEEVKEEAKEEAKPKRTRKKAEKAE